MTMLTPLLATWWWPLVTSWRKIGLFVLLLVVTPSRNAAFSYQKEGCRFPREWEGIWFQSTVRPYISVQGQTISGKGTCLRSDGDKFILKESEDCFRCVVFQQRAKNVLQYKESLGCAYSSEVGTSGFSLCRNIAGDANLYSMFRVDGSAIECPFHHLAPLSFTYDRGKGACLWPRSEVEACTAPSKVVFRYQACPNVQGSEMMTEELECLATWRDGSAHFLVGRVSHPHATTDEDKFRCFVFDGLDDDDQGDGLRLAQSGDATCNGVFSPTEGPRTLQLSKGPSKAGCLFPEWLARAKTWTSMSSAASRLVLNFANSTEATLTEATLQIIGTREFTLTETREITCHSLVADSHRKTHIRLILYQKKDCETGFVCADLVRRTNVILGLRLGALSRTADYACDSAHFGDAHVPNTRLLTAKNTASRATDLTKLPTSGFFAVSDVSPNDPLLVMPPRGLSLAAADDEDNGSQGARHEGSRSLGLPFCGETSVTMVLACPGRSDMEILVSCTDDKHSFVRGYTLTEQWTEVAEGVRGRPAQYMIFVPKRKRSVDDARPVCIRALHDGYETAGGVANLELTKLDADCQNAQGNETKTLLRFQGDCSQVTSGTSVASPGSIWWSSPWPRRWSQEAWAAFTLLSIHSLSRFRW